MMSCLSHEVIVHLLLLGYGVALVLTASLNSMNPHPTYLNSFSTNTFLLELAGQFLTQATKEIFLDTSGNLDARHPEARPLRNTTLNFR